MAIPCMIAYARLSSRRNRLMEALDVGDTRTLNYLESRSEDVVLARPERALRGNLAVPLGVTFVVPVGAGLIYLVLWLLFRDLHSQWLWIVYEVGFLVLISTVARRWVPRVAAGDPEQAALLRALCGYSAAYYGLWAFADLLIVVGGLDLGWAIRIVPNQLYYAFWVPFVHARFYAGRSSSSA